METLLKVIFEIFTFLFYFESVDSTALSVVLLPSPLVTVTPGQTITLKCQWSSGYTYGGAYVQFRRNNDPGVIGTLHLNFGTSCSQTPPYTTHCDRDNRTLELHVQPSNYNHGDTWTCEGQNDESQCIQSASTVVNVIKGNFVTVSSKNVTENATNIQLICSASDINDRLTFTWTHWYGATLIRDTFDQITTAGSQSTLTITMVTYQDMGTYKCEVEGENGQIHQTNSGKLDVTASPTVIGASKLYAVENEAMHDINISFISFPEPFNVSVVKSPDTLVPVNEVKTEPLDVPFHSTPVIVDGFIVNLHFNKFERRHAGEYQLNIQNIFPYIFTFKIVLSDKPDPPSRLSFGGITKASAVVTWVAGNNNGHAQQFTVMYRNSRSNVQMNQTVCESVTSVTLIDLEVSTEYEVSLYASNIKGVSDRISGTLISDSEHTGSAVEETMFLIGVCISVAICLSVCAVAGLLFRNSRISLRNQTTTENRDEHAISQDALQQPTDATARHEYEDVSPAEIAQVLNTITLSDEIRRSPYETLRDRQAPNVYETLEPKEDKSAREYEELTLSDIGHPSVYEGIPSTSNDGGNDDVANRNIYETLGNRPPPGVYETLDETEGSTGAQG